MNDSLALSAGAAVRSAGGGCYWRSSILVLTEIASPWTFDVERGPDWLFVKVGAPTDGDADGVNLAEKIWELMQHHFSRRVVLDLNGLRILRSVVIGQLVQLHKRIAAQGGLMRLARLSDDNYGVLAACRLNDRFPQYASIEDAVMGHRPRQPR